MKNITKRLISILSILAAITLNHCKRLPDNCDGEFTVNYIDSETSTKATATYKQYKTADIGV